MNKPPTPHQRIISIDALRGADMLLLAGGAACIQALAPLVGCEGGFHQLTHASWGEPLTCWDMVMPLFIFIVGASMPFAFQQYRERGQGAGRIILRVVRRCLLLFLLGMLVQGNLTTAAPERMHLFCNTLQAIAEGYLIAALCLLFGRVRMQIITCGALLLAYWALLRFVPYGSSPAGLFLPQDNLAIWIDRQLQGTWQDGTPYSWILTSLSFGALTLMGALGGQILRCCKWGLRTILYLLAAAGGCLLSGWLLSYDTPIIKHIYTTSMTLWSAGWCFALLAVFHAAFDLAPGPARLAYPLQIVGSNAILAYLLTQTPGLHGLTLWQSLCYPLLGGASALCGKAAEFCFSAASLILLWLLLRFLYRHRALLRV